MTRRKDVGVAVGRFQVEDPHEGHLHLIRSITRRHERTIIMVGDRDIQRNDVHSMDFETRKLMLQHWFPSIEIVELRDVGNNAKWSKNLDVKLRELGADKVRLYGSRQSFVDAYKGTHPCFLVPQVDGVSGTRLRDDIARAPINSRDFRRGIIFAMKRRYPQGHPVIDVALLRCDADGTLWVVLGKRDEEDEKWRFPGGFFDTKHDDSLEDTVLRELAEETGITNVGRPRYIGSKRIDDWRYRDSKDKIISSFYYTSYASGELNPTDDLAVVDWHKVTSLPDVIVDTHIPLADMLVQHLGRRVTHKEREFA